MRFNTDLDRVFGVYVCNARRNPFFMCVAPILYLFANIPTHRSDDFNRRWSSTGHITSGRGWLASKRRWVSRTLNLLNVSIFQFAHFVLNDRALDNFSCSWAFLRIAIQYFFSKRRKWMVMRPPWHGPLVNFVHQVFHCVSLKWRFKREQLEEKTT